MTAARELVGSYVDYEDQPMQVEPERRRQTKLARVPATLKICLVAACCVAVCLLYLQQQVTSYYLNMELVQRPEEKDK